MNTQPRNAATNINALIGHDSRTTMANASAVMSILRMAIMNSEKGGEAWPDYIAGIDILAATIENAIRYEVAAR